MSEEQKEEDVPRQASFWTVMETIVEGLFLLCLVLLAGHCGGCLNIPGL